MLRCEQAAVSAGASQLSIELVVARYLAYVWTRHSGATAAVTGTGLVTAVFS
jgi:hypothetical protein